MHMLISSVMGDSWGPACCRNHGVSPHFPKLAWTTPHLPAGCLCSSHGWGHFLLHPSCCLSVHPLSQSQLQNGLPQPPCCPLNIQGICETQCRTVSGPGAGGARGSLGNARPVQPICCYPCLVINTLTACFSSRCDIFKEIF